MRIFPHTGPVMLRTCINMGSEPFPASGGSILPAVQRIAVKSHRASENCIITGIPLRIGKINDLGLEILIFHPCYSHTEFCLLAAQKGKGYHQFDKLFVFFVENRVIPCIEELAVRQIVER